MINHFLNGISKMVRKPKSLLGLGFSLGMSYVIYIKLKGNMVNVLVVIPPIAYITFLGMLCNELKMSYKNNNNEYDGNHSIYNSYKHNSKPLQLVSKVERVNFTETRETIYFHRGDD